MIRGKKRTDAGVDVEKRESLHTAGGIVQWHSHYGKQYRVSSKKIKIELSHNPTSLPLCIYPKKMENTNLKIYIHPHAHCRKYIYIPIALFTVTRTWKQPKCPLMLNKEEATYTQWNTIQYHKHRILPFVMICMDLEDIKWYKSEKDKYYMISLIHGILKQQQQTPKPLSS